MLFLSCQLFKNKKQELWNQDANRVYLLKAKIKAAATPIVHAKIVTAATIAHVKIVVNNLPVFAADRPPSRGWPI
jgi:hypothetical protein